MTTATETKSPRPLRGAALRAQQQRLIKAYEKLVSISCYLIYNGNIEFAKGNISINALDEAKAIVRTYRDRANLAAPIRTGENWFTIYGKKYDDFFYGPRV